MLHANVTNSERETSLGGHENIFISVPTRIWYCVCISQRINDIFYDTHVIFESNLLLLQWHLFGDSEQLLEIKHWSILTSERPHRTSNLLIVEKQVLHLFDSAHGDYVILMLLLIVIRKGLQKYSQMVGSILHALSKRKITAVWYNHEERLS